MNMNTLIAINSLPLLEVQKIYSALVLISSVATFQPNLQKLAFETDDSIKHIGQIIINKKAGL